MSSSRLAFVCLAFLLFLSCSRAPVPEPRRLAVLPFQNLSSDVNLDWMGRAIGGMTAAEIVPSQSLKAIDAPTERDARLARATATLEGTFTVTGGRIRALAYLREGQKNVRMLEASAALTESPMALADTFAKQLSAGVRQFDTGNREAIRHFYLASDASSLPQVLAEVTAAVSADPGFGKAQVVRTEALLASNDKDEAQKAMQAAYSAPHLSEADRARLDLLAANLDGDVPTRLKATRKLAGLTDDVQLWRSLAEQQLVQRDFAAAADAFEQALRLTPEDTQTWNLLAYARGYAGNLSGAEQAIAEYRRLAPQDFNALDSLGEIYYSAGRFGEAEKAFLEAFEHNPSLLAGGDMYRAALSKWMAGDPAGADQHFAKYLEHRKNLKDPVLPVREAIWLYESGRAEQAVQRLRELAKQPNEMGSLAAAQLAVTLAGAGQLGPAREALTPNVSGPARLIVAADAAPAGPPNVTAWWLLLHGRNEEAANLWTKIYKGVPGVGDSEPRIALAWALVASGRADQARPLLATPPSPAPAPEPGFATLLLPKWRELREKTAK